MPGSPLRHRAPPPAPRLVERHRGHPRRERLQLLASFGSHPRSHQCLLHRVLRGWVAPGREGHGVHHARVLALQEPADLGVVQFRFPSLEPGSGRRSSPIVGRLPVPDRLSSAEMRSRARSGDGVRSARDALRTLFPALWPSPRPARGARRDALPRLTRGGPRGGTTLDPPDRHGRPAMGHALVDAGGPALTRRAWRHVLGVVHDELALLPEPCVDPHRPVPAHHGRVPASPPVRWIQVLPRHDDDRHGAPVRWVPHRLLREVPRLLPIRRARGLRPTGMEPLGGVRALGVPRVRAHDRRHRAPLRDRRRGLLDRRPRGGDGGLHPRERRSGLRGLRPSGAARPGDPRGPRRRALRGPPSLAASVLQRAGRRGQAGARAGDDPPRARPHVPPGCSPDRPVPDAPGSRSGGGSTARRARGHGATRRRAGDLHLGQRPALGGAPLGEERGPVRGGDPRSARYPRRSDRVRGRPGGPAPRVEHRSRPDDRGGGRPAAPGRGRAQSAPAPRRPARRLAPRRC